MGSVQFLTGIAFSIVAASALTWLIAKRTGSAAPPKEDLDARESRSRQETLTAMALLLKPLADDIRALGVGAAEGRQSIVLAQAEVLSSRFDAMSTTLRESLREGRDEQGRRLDSFREAIERTLSATSEDHERRMDGLQAKVGERLDGLQRSNEDKLEQMRLTVDEKLQSTLERRLGESFSMVAERLEQVQRGFGEMQAVARDVGGLKRILANVKTRGLMGEAQLGALLGQFLAPGQYGEQVRVNEESREAVDFAVRLPGMGNGEIWLPIDAKFPMEDYARLMDAQDSGEASAIEKAGKSLEARIVLEARRIREKYVVPPYTADFALLFLPSEGLFAEVIRRGDLFSRLQTDHCVTVVGPTTLSAYLGALQVGFRTLAITRHTSDIARTLHEVRAEFGKFGDTIEAVERKLEAAHQEMGGVAVRTRAMTRRLRAVDAIDLPPLPDDAAVGTIAMLGMAAPAETAGPDGGDA
jgi:DNA recombination protein RmuC